MTESSIFEILLNSNCESINKNVNYPKLHAKTAELIAEKFTRIIYDTVKNKSSHSTTKRSTILKFLQNLSCNGPENHLAIDETNYRIFLRFIDDQLPKSDEFVETLASRELIICDEIVEFNRRKNRTNRRRIERLKTIRKYEDRLNFVNPIFRQEIAEDFIRGLFRGNCGEFSGTTTRICSDYRERQVKFCYALLNLNEFEKLKEFCRRISDYRDLEKFEIDFVKDLVVLLRNNREFIDFLYDTFNVFYKKQLIGFCTELLVVEEFSVELHDYEIYRILSGNNRKIRTILDNLLLQLYVFSYCNENIEKLRQLL